MKHSIANYPKKFKGTVISPLKICLQFDDVQSKVRINSEAGGLAKMPDTIQALPIKATGTAVETVSVGCPIKVLEDLQMALINAYRAYYKYHGETYKEEFGVDFFHFLLMANDQLGCVIHDILTNNLVPIENNHERTNPTISPN